MKSVALIHRAGIFMIVCCACLYLPGPSYADSITLKSGQKIKVKILEVTKDAVTVDFSGTKITYFMDELDSYDKEGAAAEAVDAQGQAEQPAEVPEKKDYSSLSAEELRQQAQQKVENYAGRVAEILEAEEMYNASLEKSPQSAEAYAGIATAKLVLACRPMAACDSELLKQSEENVQKALTIDPRHFKARLAASGLALMNNNIQLAREMLEKAKASDPDSALTDIQEAKILWREKRLTEALDANLRGLKRAKTAYERRKAYAGLTTDYERLSRLDEAAEACGKLAELEDSILAKARCAGLHYRREDWDLAIEWAEKAMQQSAGKAGRIHFAKGHFQKGRRLWEKDRNAEKALEHFKKTVETSTEVPELNFFMGECYFHLGNVAEAQAAYEREIELNPEFAAAHERLKALSEAAIAAPPPLSQVP